MSNANSVDPELARLAGLDLNLLVEFSILVDERSVTRAAERSGVTQPAMSHTLARLRELFGDPLLVRQRGGMALTPRAEELRAPIKSALRMLGRAIEEPGGFSPLGSHREFRVATPDLFELLLLPRLHQMLSVEAPEANVTLHSAASPLLAEQLASGATDMAVVARFDGQEGTLPRLEPAGLSRVVLFSDKFSCFVRRGHELCRGGRSRISLSDFLQFGHVQIAPSGAPGGLVDDMLAERGKARRVACRVPQFAAALRITEVSDLILTAPASLQELGGERVVSFTPPISLPHHALLLVWNERFTQDPGHRWFRDLIVRLCQKMFRQKVP
jgi:DNA-binding transcriptional LysR family regulator